MARTVRDAKLETRTARGRLQPRGAPYFRAIDQGLHLGYRRNQVSGKWLARCDFGGRYQHEPIGAADDVAEANGSTVFSFAQAQARARELFAEHQRRAAGSPAKPVGPYTVKACMADYAAWLEQNRRTARDAHWRIDALILPALGDVDCARLTTKSLREWRDALAKQPARLRTRKGRPQRFRAADQGDDPDEALRRRHASTNRVVTTLKAALNHAWREKRIASDEAWRALRPFKGAAAARVRYLTIEEARRLINAADPDFRKLVQVALQTGARYGELGALLVGDFNPDSGTLHVRTSKSGTGRHIVLTEEGVAFVKTLCAGRGSQERLLPKATGERWGKSHQSVPMRDACIRARIDPPANFHALRHSYASLAVMNGAPLLVVARNLSHTDTRMVEKHYGHLSSSYVADAIRAAAPRFGLAEQGVVALQRG